MTLDDYISRNPDVVQRNIDFTEDVFVIEDIEGEFVLTQGRRHNANGWVYILEAHPNIYKIGRSRDYKTRHKMLSITLPFEVKVKSAIVTDDMIFGEELLHRMYERYRMKGEWFNLPNEEVDKLSGVYSMYWYSPSEFTKYLDEYTKYVETYTRYYTEE
jgi:hypothetical protein